MGFGDLDPEKRRRLLTLAVVAVAAVIALIGRPPTLSVRAPPAVGSPDCRLEPGPGPMRCADPNDPNSYWAMKRPLFGFTQLPAPAGGEADPICVLFTPGQMLKSYGIAFPPAASPGFPAREPAYAFMNFEVDLKRRQMTITELRARDGKASEPALKVKLYDVPQRGWPCRPLNWSWLMANHNVSVDDVPDRR